MISKKEPVVFDIELMGKGNDVAFFFGARHLPSGKTIGVWGEDQNGLDKVAALFRNPNYLFVSFNGRRFDAPVIAAVLGGRPTSDAKRLANSIIEENKPEWMTYRDANLERMDFDHIDLIEPAPGVMVNLKLYAARMGLKSITDLPYKHDHILTPEQRIEVADYCLNGDLVATASLFNELQGALELREQMTAQYGIDLRSKSDAQVAEAVFAKALGIRGTPPVPKSVRYKAPPFIQPRNMILREKLELAQRHTFDVDQRNGAVILPKFLEEPIIIGKGRYQMGIGGLHDTHCKAQHWVAGPDLEISDFDVESHYPRTILNAGLIPRGLGLPFINLYEKILNERLAAKRSGDKVKNGAMKIMLNGTFGKLGSMFSKVYAPDLLIATTLTGQFFLLGLIELIIENGGHIVSANTDGVCVAATKADMAMIRDTVWLYGWATNFEFEETKYRTVAYKDVNNYIAVKLNGSAKAKGIYAESGLMKNPTNEVCTMAAQAYLVNGTPVEDFIREHLRPDNFADFTQSRVVNGGAIQYRGRKLMDDWIPVCRGQWRREAWPATRATHKRVSRPNPVEVGDDPVFLGRVARWYYSTDDKLTINYQTNDSLVGKSASGRACLKLPNTIPDDLDLERYIAETKTNLRNMGVRV